MQKVYGRPGQSRPVFIVGSGRSGTTMLIKQLDESWQVELYNEGHPAAFDRWRLKKFAAVDQLIERSRAPITVFKPILDTPQALDYLERYPDGRVLFAVRHYADVINSSLKMFGRENRLGHVQAWVEDDFSEFSHCPPPEVTKEFVRSRWTDDLSFESGGALFWLFINRLFFDLGLDQHDRARLVEYNALVTDPGREFGQITEFLGLSFDPRITRGVYASSVRRNPAPEIDPQLQRDCEELWQRIRDYSDRQSKAAGTK